MLIVIYLLLMLRVGRCVHDQIFETKTVGVGQNVTLTCSRHTSKRESEILYWIRLASGKLPEFLGGTFAFDYDGLYETSHITAKQEPGTFILHIHKTKPSDTGFYYCIKVDQLDLTILKGALLRIKGAEPDITAVIQDFPSDPVRPGDSVTLQCSVLFDSEKKTCPEEHRVFWFRAGSDESHPSLIYAQGSNSDGCEKSPEAPQKCVYSFSETISSSDAGTYYCAVATCGEILFGNGAKLDIEALDMWDLQRTDTVLLCAALAISLIGNALLIYSIKKKTCDRSKAAVALQTNAATVSSDQQSQQRNEDSLAYSAPNFTKKNAGRVERRNVNTAEGETIYTDVRTGFAH